jgi:hypothetical protein
VADGEKESSPVQKSLEAKYANYFEIGFNQFELVIDFGQMYSPDSIPALHTRMITSPSYGRALLELLSNALTEHARKFRT